MNLPGLSTSTFQDVSSHGAYSHSGGHVVWSSCGQAAVVAGLADTAARGWEIDQQALRAMHFFLAILLSHRTLHYVPFLPSGLVHC